MDDSGQKQSGLQHALHAAEAARTAANIARAAVVSGPTGAAVETAKSAAPRILKLALCAAVVLLLLPMAVFISLPHVFFGYFHSANPPVVLATDQAMELGYVCMSLDEFQNTVIDSIITAIVNSYEQAGISIDEIQIINHFEEDDLLWFISINSVANKQNLNEISVDTIRELCADKLDYHWTLLTGERTILRIVINKIQPDVWMEKLSFPEDAKTWTRAFDETLTESDALSKYGSYYTGHTPNYGGDPTAPDYPDTPQRPPDNPEPGGGFSNGLDTTGYVNPSVKNNLDLILIPKETVDKADGGVIYSNRVIKMKKYIRLVAKPQKCTRHAQAYEVRH